MFPSLARPFRVSPVYSYRVIASSLRLRLILAFSALVSLVLFVGIASYSINQQVRTNVSDLQPSDRVDISGIDWKRLGVEFLIRS